MAIDRSGVRNGPSQKADACVMQEAAKTHARAARVLHAGVVASGCGETAASTENGEPAVPSGRRIGGVLRAAAGGLVLFVVGVVSASPASAQADEPTASRPSTTSRAAPITESEPVDATLGGVIPVGAGEEPASIANSTAGAVSEEDLVFALEPMPAPDNLLRVSSHKVPMRCFATDVSPTYGELFAEGSVVQQLDTRDEFTLVRMPEGPVGYVHSRYTTPPDIAGRARTVGTLVSFRFEPRSGVAPVTRLSDGSPLLIVGREGEWWRVRYREAPVWVKSNVLQPVVDRQRGVDAWDALGKQLRADNVAFAKELAAKEAALAAENARRELLQSINTRFVVESRKPVREQDYDPLLAEIGVMLEELTEDAPEHVTLTKLRSEIERSQKMAKAVRLADVEEPPAPVEVADPVIETPPDPTERFEAIGWIVARRLRNGEPRYELQQGGLTTMLLQSRRYDLQQFAGYEVGVNGTPFRAHLSSDRRLDVQEIEVLSARRRRR